MEQPNKGNYAFTDETPMDERLIMKDVHRGPVHIWTGFKGTVFVDIDGTVADLSHRRGYVRSKPKNWPAFERGIPHDTPIQWVIDAVNRLYNSGWTVVMMSGRSERNKRETVDWLKKYGVSYHALYMRHAYEFEPDGITVKLTKNGDPKPDCRSDDIVKKELLEEAREDGYNPDIVFDDRDRVVKMWRENGIPVVQVAEGDF